MRVGYHPDDHWGYVKAWSSGGVMFHQLHATESGFEASSLRHRDHFATSPIALFPLESLQMDLLTEEAVRFGGLAASQCRPPRTK